MKTGLESERMICQVRNRFLPLRQVCLSLQVRKRGIISLKVSKAKKILYYCMINNLILFCRIGEEDTARMYGSNWWMPLKWCAEICKYFIFISLNKH